MTIQEVTTYIDQLKESGYNTDQIKGILKNSKFNKREIQGAYFNQHLGIDKVKKKIVTSSNNFKTNPIEEKKEFMTNNFNYSYYGKDFQKIKLSTIAMIFAVFFPIMGLILAILALKNPKEENKKLAKTALYVSIFFLIIPLILFLLSIGTKFLIRYI